MGARMPRPPSEFQFSLRFAATMGEDRARWAGVDTALLGVGRVSRLRTRAVIRWRVRGILVGMSARWNGEATAMTCAIVKARTRYGRRWRCETRTRGARGECRGSRRAKPGRRLRIICILLTGTSGNWVVAVDRHHGTLGWVVRYGQRSWPAANILRDSDARGRRTNTRG